MILRRKKLGAQLQLQQNRQIQVNSLDSEQNPNPNVRGSGSASQQDSLLRNDEHEYQIEQQEFVEDQTLEVPMKAAHSPYFEAMTDDQNSLRPMFKDSRIDAKSFCTEFISIAQTFELSEKACNDLLNLVKRMASPDYNACPDDIYNARLRVSYDHVPSPDLATNMALPTSKILHSPKNMINTHEPKIEVAPFKKPRGRPPGSSKATKYLAMAEAYEKQKQHLEAVNNQEQLAPYDGNEGKFNAIEQQQYIQGEEVEWSEGMNYMDEEEEFVVVDDYVQEESSQTFQGHQEGGVMNQVLYSLNKLSKDVTSLRRQYAQAPKPKEEHTTHQYNEMKRETLSSSTEKPIKMRQRHDFDRRRPKYFVKIFDEDDRNVPICDMSREDMINTVRISRDDPETRIMYHDQDITDRLLQKLDISLYLHNPSYCGRAVADALFNPEFLSRFHILSEGQTISRSYRENLSPELTKVFYDTLRKLGASRIIPDDQLGWMEQARDAVNQRNRDILIPGCRRKFFQNSDPIFE